MIHAYIRDALSGKASRIPLRNRKFLVTYGEDCDELFARLGFSKRSAQGEDDAAWYQPTPVQEWDRVEGDALRDLLDDSLQELMCLIDRMPHSAKQELKRYSYQPQAARDTFERALGSFNCELGSDQWYTYFESLTLYQIPRSLGIRPAHMVLRIIRESCLVTCHPFLKYL